MSEHLRASDHPQGDAPNADHPAVFHALDLLKEGSKSAQTSADAKPAPGGTEKPASDSAPKSAEQAFTYKPLVSHTPDGTLSLTLDPSGKPYDVMNTDAKGNQTHIEFGSNGYPENIYQSGKNAPDFLDFKTPDGTDYRFTSLHPVIDGQHPEGQVKPNLTITSPGEHGDSTVTYAKKTDDGWSKDEIEKDFANGNREYTYFNEPLYGDYKEHITRNSDGGYNAEFFRFNGTPVAGLEDYRMIPNADRSKDFTYTKPDGTIDRRVHENPPRSSDTE